MKYKESPQRISGWVWFIEGGIVQGILLVFTPYNPFNSWQWWGLTILGGIVVTPAILVLLGIKKRP